MESLGANIIASGEGAGLSYAEACKDKAFVEKAARSKATARASLTAFAKAQLAAQAVDMLSICAGGVAPTSAASFPPVAQPLPFSRKPLAPVGVEPPPPHDVMSQFRLLASQLSIMILSRLQIANFQHSTKAIFLVVIGVLVLPKVWLVLMDFVIRAFSQLFWLTLGAILQSLERETQTACAFVELALKTLVEHTFYMVFPALYASDYSSSVPVLARANTNMNNVTSNTVSHPGMPYPSLLLSYNTIGVTYLLYRGFRR